MLGNTRRRRFCRGSGGLPAGISIPDWREPICPPGDRWRIGRSEASCTGESRRASWQHGHLYLPHRCRRWSENARSCDGLPWGDRDAIIISNRGGTPPGATIGEIAGRLSQAAHCAPSGYPLEGEGTAVLDGTDAAQGPTAVALSAIRPQYPIACGHHRRMKCGTPSAWMRRISDQSEALASRRFDKRWM